MRLFKLITGGLVLFVIGLFLWQNVPTFTAPLEFQLDLYIKEHLKWTLQVYTLLLIVGFLGFVFGLLVMLRPYFNVRRLLAQERQQQIGQQSSPPMPGVTSTTQEEIPEQNRSDDKS